MAFIKKKQLKIRYSSAILFTDLYHIIYTYIYICILFTCVNKYYYGKSYLEDFSNTLWNSHDSVEGKKVINPM